MRSRHAGSPAQFLAGLFCSIAFAASMSVVAPLAATAGAGEKNAIGVVPFTPASAATVEDVAVLLAAKRLEPASDSAVPAVVEKLATLTLADLAQVEAAPVLAPVRAARARSAESSETVDDSDDDGLSLMPGAKNDDPISINSEELEVVPLDGGRRLVFSRNVIVVQGDIRLHADRLEAIYPAGASQPEKLVAEGHVSVAQGERNASCEEATYERTLQTIVCRGKAEVVQGCDRVRGREIEFDLEHERVRVTGAASVLIRPDDDVECMSKAAIDSKADPASGGNDRPRLDDPRVLH